jgi:two-component system nitrate/nitrite response regulator NarL
MFRPSRVLVVDDHPLMAEALERRLDGRAGIDVVAVVGDAEAALPALACTSPDVVLVDLSGDDAAAVLLGRLRECCPAIRTVAMVEERAAGSVAQLAALADGLITTRATADEVVDAVEVVLAGGAALAPHVAAELLRAYAARRRAGEPCPLEDRQERALELAVRGLTDIEIADRLDVSRRTVQRLLAGVRASAGLRRRADLVRWATARSDGAAS